MNREIIFKAKRKDSGEWVEGDLLHTRHADVVLISDFKDILFRCDGNTLCQYSGLTDKNGKKIWENDIVKWRFKRAWKEDCHISQVVWDSFYSAFKISVRGGLAKLREDIEYEIIGNVFDNAELLEVEEIEEPKEMPVL